MIRIGLSFMAVHNIGRVDFMTYTEFCNMFKEYLTGKQLADMQDLAFRCYTVDYGYRPMRKNQKQVAYGIIQELFYRIDVEDCVDYLKQFDVPRYKAVEFWQSLEWIKGA